MPSLTKRPRLAYTILAHRHACNVYPKNCFLPTHYDGSNPAQFARHMTIAVFQIATKCILEWLNTTSKKKYTGFLLIHSLKELKIYLNANDLLWVFWVPKIHFVQISKKNFPFSTPILNYSLLKHHRRHNSALKKLTYWVPTAILPAVLSNHEADRRCLYLQNLRSQRAIPSTFGRPVKHLAVKWYESWVFHVPKPLKWCQKSFSVPTTDITNSIVSIVHSITKWFTSIHLGIVLSNPKRHHDTIRSHVGGRDLRGQRHTLDESLTEAEHSVNRWSEEVESDGSFFQPWI